MSVKLSFLEMSGTVGREQEQGEWEKTRWKRKVVCVLAPFLAQSLSAADDFRFAVLSKIHELIMNSLA